MRNYDYIIVGGGASGLLLADALGSDPFFGEKKIALIEKSPEKGNDRTWCFWEAGPGPFDALLHREWTHIRFTGPEGDQKVSIDPYRYKMLRGADFYREFYRRIGEYPNIEIRFEEVTEVSQADSVARVLTPQGDYRAPLVFSSVSFTPRETLMRPFPLLQQHFIGWFVRSENPIFDPEAPTFMDFSIPQMGNTRFMYILPFSPYEGLVEYTLFSEQLLETGEYEAALAAYLTQRLGSHSYEILEKEKGSIPMTVNDFSAADGPNLVHIGIAGGWAKPSTGYTFWNTCQQVPKLVEALKKGQVPRGSGKDKFWYYDLLLLDVLARENGRGSEIFSMLFKNLRPQLIFKFLNEETSLPEDFRIISSSPKGMFLRAFVRALFRLPS
jgi:lycopene beta-cyclase